MTLNFVGGGIFINKLKTHTKVLLIITVIVLVFTAITQSISSGGNDIFLEKVSFGEFYVSYKEPFILTEDTNLKITLKCQIEKGLVRLRIFSDDGKICYEKEGNSLNEDVIVPIEKGNWYYSFTCNSGVENIEAENGEYEACIQVTDE